MRLQELIAEGDFVLETRGDTGVNIESLMADSRKKMSNALFFCIPGLRFDAHDYAKGAVKNGACALIVERFLDEIPVAQVRVKSVRAAMSYIARAFYGCPSDGMKLIGITGTKGKTTTSYMIKSIIEKAGYRCGLIGTTGSMIADKHLKSELTTPDPIDLQQTLRLMADDGVKVVVMEVSAHALSMDRLAGMRFEVGIYTNLSQDHLDYFGTMDNYFAAKKTFFTNGLAKNGAFNADDERAESMLSGLTIPKVTFAIAHNADLFARDIEVGEDGVNFKLMFRDLEQHEIRLRLTGMFNVYNALAAASAAYILGIPASTIKEGLENLRAVPGREETLETGTPFKVILDYAHSPEALHVILTTVRQFARGRIIAVFGCGGDRDHAKRAIMGEIGGTYADFCVLTSDNPRTEDPYDILASLEEGIKRTDGAYTIIENRREAILYAMKMAESGDIVLLAGKGHETYQEINGVKHPFDEKVVVAELLKAHPELVR
jgi:UDP-N-acetylmuramoyl-L-alanyl-D-glutamate--2,6-diaminopimelate ligase